MLKEKKYTPAGSGENLAGATRSLIADFSVAYRLGWLFATRNIKARYRQSLLGILWAFIIPISTSLVWIILNKQRVFSFDNIPCNYPAFVIVGTIFWQVFTVSVLGPIQSVSSNKSILTKVNFPRESILIASFFETFLTALIGLIIITVVLLITGTQVTAGIIYVVPGIIMLMLIGTGIGLLILPFSMLYQDINFALSPALQFLMYLTPVVYPKPVFSGFLFDYNPIGTVLQFVRNQLFTGSSDTSLLTIGLIFAAAIVLFMIGVFLYRITLEILIERIG